MADKHEKAKDMAEKGLEKAVEGDRKEGEALVDKARKMDEQAVRELAREVEDDARQAEHTVSRDKPS